jgi:putative DNA primase/helicase
MVVEEIEERKAAPPKERPAKRIEGTDVANGRQFVADHAHAVRFVADWGVWVVFDGARWVPDRSSTIIEALAKQTTDGMVDRALARLGSAMKEDAGAGLGGGKSAEVQAAHRAVANAGKAQDVRAIGRMLYAARSEPAVVVPFGRELFDRHPHLLNCPNGTIDLRTGELRPHDRRDFLTRMCPTEYDPGADRAEYLQFLDRVFDGRPAVAEYVRRLSGYAATGETCDHSFHIFCGDGANGKSVLLNLWTGVLGEGEYAHNAVSELLVNGGGERHPTELVGLQGARLAVCAESREDGRLDEAKLKALTSDDLVKARAMRQDFFKFAPTHKLILATNYRPRVHGTDHGIWRRLRLVPFASRFWTEADRAADTTGTFDEAFRADPGLLDRLRGQFARGVLADMVEHAAEFYRTGRALVPPSEVAAETAAYRRTEDVIGEFFQARVRPDERGREKSSDLYDAFRTWCEAQGVGDVPNIQKFGREAKKRFETREQSGMTRYRVRLLHPQAEGGGD